MSEITIDKKQPRVQKFEDIKLTPKFDRNFPNFIESYIEYTENQETPPRVHRWVATSIIAGALERKCWINFGYENIYPNLFVLVVGGSGSVRKSTSTSIGVKLLRKLKDIRFMGDTLTQAALIEKVFNSGTRFVDKNLHEHRQSAVYCYSSEFIVFVTELKGDITKTLTTLYDSQNEIFTKETKMEGELNIYGPCLNVLGCSTPDWLVQAIPPDQMAGGFASRFIFVVETGPRVKKISWPKVDEARKKMGDKLVDDLKAIHAMSGEFKPTKEAYELYDKWYQEDESIENNDDRRFQGYFARKYGHLLKVALIYAAAKGKRYVIDVDDLEDARKHLEDLEDTMFEAFGASGRNVLAKAAHDIQKMLKAKGILFTGQLLGAFKNDINNVELAMILKDLALQNLIRIYRVASDPEGQQRVQWLKKSKQKLETTRSNNTENAGPNSDPDLV